MNVALRVVCWVGARLEDRARASWQALLANAYATAVCNPPRIRPPPPAPMIKYREHRFFNLQCDRCGCTVAEALSIPSGRECLPMETSSLAIHLLTFARHEDDCPWSPLYNECTCAVLPVRPQPPATPMPGPGRKVRQ